MTKQFGSFSDAIRAADNVLPQSFMGPGARDLLQADSGKVCALEAGLTTTRSLPSDARDIYAAAMKLYPYLITRTDCPRCDEEKGEALVNLIWHLNDDHHLSFGQIADWLQSEEDKLGFVTISVTEEPDQRFQRREAHRNLMGELRELSKVCV